MQQIILSGLEELQKYCCNLKKVLIVHGTAFDKSAIREFICSDYVEFTEFTSNPTYDDVCKGVEFFKKNDCDSIIACGGGSTIDVAKCIKMFAGMTDTKEYLAQEYVECGVKILAIPTTAGTGSEATRRAVVYYQGVKKSVSDIHIIPDAILFIPEFLIDLPEYQKKCTLLDALCQAIESWWSKKRTDESINYSKKAIQLIKDNWKSYLEGDESVFSDMLEASFYSGKAINITTTTAAHAMSYKLTSMFGIPHGHAVAICLLEVWKHMQEILNKDSAPIFVELKAVFEDIEMAVGINWYADMLKTMNIHAPQTNSMERDIQVLADSVNTERLGNNPLIFDKNELMEIYRSVFLNES